MLLYRLADSLDRAKIPYALVGGFAVALHGAVRGTVDIDLVIRFSEKDFTGFERAMARLGLSPRLPVKAAEVYRFRDEYVRERNLIAWSFYNPSAPSEVIDVIITHDVRDMHPVKMKVGKLTVSVASIKDLIGMKTRSGRPQDLADVAALKRLDR